MHIHENFYQDLSRVIRFHRRKSGLTQAALAKLAGVGKTVVFDVEHEKQTLQIDTLLKILKALNISIQFNSPLMNLYREGMHAKS